MIFYKNKIQIATLIATQLVIFNPQCFAADAATESAPAADTPVDISADSAADATDQVSPYGSEHKRPLTQEEIHKMIGRMGEVEEVPEGFKFSDAEHLMWQTEHLKNIDKPMRLYYEFTKSGSYEDGFNDSVYLDIIKINDDGTKNAVLDFFTGDRKQHVTPDNVTNITGNPVLGVYMQGDVMEMNRLTEGHWRHFQKMIKIALRKSAKVTPVTFDYNGKKVQGQKVEFSPYLDDPHRPDFAKFANKTYELLFSDEVPGDLYEIKTVINDAQDATKEPLMVEKLVLVEATPTE